MLTNPSTTSNAQTAILTSLSNLNTISNLNIDSDPHLPHAQTSHNTNTLEDTILLNLSSLNISDSTVPELDPAVQFDLLRIKTRRAGSFPRSVKIIVWNCCGLKRKYHQIHDLFTETGADILVLNETFRPSSSPWPKNLPPCLGEATFRTQPSDTYRRNLNGVAVLANPKSIGLKGAIRSYEVLDVDNETGTKVVLRINNFVLFSVYAPTSIVLSNHFSDAKRYATGNQPVI